MDFVVSFTPSKDGCNAIMVIVFRLTKRVKFIATQTTDSAEYTANVFMKNYMKDHDLSKTIVTPNLRPSFGRLLYLLWERSIPCHRRLDHKRMDKRNVQTVLSKIIFEESLI
ncbi:FOG: Transposon-encoded proteins with TYA, reverse transcriptase, integrase domains in various combinations [Plasmopara halstedii]|uniref:FOG: Transposon-encoded proteins with TYA, reverse transcriptase, integrase domains in various combinations n=1 Tax=Plasmopara halstedii TaxID=4781 RepID=A0A0P1AAR4_PLAHL|nr:FOG: Transposon-encoded proteins with TYA, reverse transcriptase, integrase domains in various combinations [Plasmopara halstedii]CEG37909.1 FOG: Transposon-encoded proteins with TYA, reverse transcriptase, integrase domains in various combinations [Plasmopara halstedii]|eukprot:XP_024574278.1 FOG: Transposon-encoded proteins with TYA, reverse transcriptase, integrase domains in various combinations [Plasmopara halstedii]